MSIQDTVIVAEYPQPPELVWRVIATKEGLDSWFMANDFESAKVGHEFRFTNKPRPFWNGICDCRVLEADAPRRFALLWNHKQDAQPSIVSWTLTPTSSGGTRVEFRHAGLKGFMGLLMKKGMQKGWDSIMRGSLPFVASELAGGRFPEKAEVEAAKKQAREEKRAA